MSAGGADAVLLIGVYGSGKSSVAIEMAHILEADRVSYGLLDLDFLGWFDTGKPDAIHGSDRTVFLANVSAVRQNYLAAGVRHLVLAGSVAAQPELDDLARAVAVPLRVVRLEVPLDQIERRLECDVTSGRSDDLLEARRQLAANEGVGLEDLLVENTGPIRDVATEILAWLGWRSGPA